MNDISESGSYVYMTYDHSTLLGNARQTVTFGPRHQWFQVFEFNRKLNCPKAGVSQDKLVYRDEILDFKHMLFEDKTLEAWDTTPLIDMMSILGGSEI